LPITDLATGVTRPEDFIGLHFFSPVDKMPLLEIVVGEKTSDATIAKAIDIALQIKKTPIVVNDSRGFFTSRVIMTFMGEAVALLAEGVPAPSIEQAALQSGYPTGPLALFDEISILLGQRIYTETRRGAEAAGKPLGEHPAFDVVNYMVDDAGRGGRGAGAGFYDYSDGKRLGLWGGLVPKFGGTNTEMSFDDVKERMLFAEVLESVRCYEEGVLRSVPEANIGSIFGIGFPPWSGGVLQFVNGYSGGVAGFVARARELADRYGERFEPTAGLVAMAAEGRHFE
jgi:3-hydroxyacyl-CoA dehydrogenase/enoyl-CoA hydratase/3-hydroxybutyryl-CoA epimerase